eukprot:Skav230263  [mRNA]  locus=scaffold3387:126512:129952:- [translate_table: standard]
MRKVRPHKAVGPDKIPGEVCHHVPGPMAHHYFPLLLKAALFGMEPLDFKGGRLTMAWKRKGDQTQCMSYRSLLVSSHAGKACHRALRDLHVQDFEAALRHDQLGGKRGIPVTLAMHVVRAHQRHCLAQKKASSIIFLDLREAFYRTLRELAIGASPGRFLDQWIAGLDLPADTVSELRQMLTRPSAIETAGFSQVHRNMVKALHDSTWFYLHNQPDKVLTSIGSRPGDCFADWVFSMLFSRVLDVLEQRLSSLALLDVYPVASQPGLDASLDSSGSLCTLGPTWMDDLAILVSADSSDALVEKTSKILSELLSVCMSHGMSPNLSKGKTEVVMHLTGSGSAFWRQHFFNVGGKPTLDIVSESGVKQVHVSPSYKHLGGLVHHTGQGFHEAKQRFAQAHQAYGEHRRLIFANSAFSLSQKLAMLEALVMSKLLYGVETLVLAKPREFDSLNASLIRLYKRVLGLAHDGHHTNAEVLARIELPDFQTLQSRARLRYYASIYRNADTKLWGILQHDSSWTTLVRQDLKWMHHRLLLSVPLPDPDVDLSPWHALMSQRPKYWKRLVTRTVRSQVLFQKMQFTVDSFHLQFCRRLQDLDLLPDEPHVDLPPQQHFGCMFCGRAARSKAGEAVHQFRSHQVIARERLLCDTTQCPGCLIEFHTAARLQRHLQASRTCRAMLRTLQHPVQPLPGIGSRGNQAQEAMLDDLLPPLQALGPLAPAPPLLEEVAHDLGVCDAVLVGLLDGLEPSTTLSTLRSSVAQCLRNTVTTWTTCRCSLLHVANTLSAEDAEVTGFSLSVLQNMLRELASPEAWDFLWTIPQAVHRDHSKTTDFWTDFLQNELDADNVDDRPGPVRPLGAHRIVLHLFSGRRRPGDIQTFLEALPCKEGTTLHIISLDLIFHARWGDLSRDDVQAWWLGCIRSGWIAGMLAGPPCSTWTKARGRVVEGKTHAPRILRSQASPWGIDAEATYSIRERLQLHEGNVLLFFCLTAALELWWSGGAAIIEHPACPHEHGLASIWRTAPVRYLASLPGFEEVHLWQGHFGAKSPKPTQMLVLHLESFAATLKQNQLTQTLPTGRSIGLNQAGGWCTTSLKEYPPCLNLGMATAFSTFLDLAPVCDRQIPSHFWQVIEPMQAQFSHVMGMDCDLSHHNV